MVKSQFKSEKRKKNKQQNNIVLKQQKMSLKEAWCHVTFKYLSTCFTHKYQWESYTIAL